MKVRDIMTTGVKTATPDTNLEEIAVMMKNEDVGSIPVVDGEDLVGIVTDRDIVVRCVADGNDPAKTDAEEIVSQDLETVEPDDDIEDASRLMSDRQIRRLPVVEDGRLVGMISLGDIAVKEDERKAGRALENISDGVKASGRTAQKTPGKSQAARSSVTAIRQGISNRGGRDEITRQQRVNPKRTAAGSSGRRRRAG